MIEIKVFVPSYFDKFRCIADKCPDTCCIGWEVDIDEETAEKYTAVNGALGEKIKKHLAEDETGCKLFTLCDGSRCPFLNNSNLCQIHLEAGEKYLSKTCTLFPRFFDTFGNIREMGLGFGCPEGARLILEEKEPFSLKLYEEIDAESEEIDEDFLDKLLSLRKELFDILEEDLCFKQKIEKIFSRTKIFQQNLDGDDFCDDFQERNFEDCITLLENMEYINIERKNFIQNFKSENLSVKYNDDFKKLMQYYIFRYLLKTVYDYDVLTKIKYGVFACIVISRIYSFFENPDFEARVKIIYSFSKEVEYSDTNMDLLDETLFYDFGTKDLINLL